MSDDKTTNEPFNLNDYTYRLLESEPFFASLSRRINKSINTSRSYVWPSEATSSMPH